MLQSLPLLKNTEIMLQLVVTGDFFQLPPVTKNGKEPFFAFECEAWQRCIDHTVTLTQVYLQKDDRRFYYSRLPTVVLISPPQILLGYLTNSAAARSRLRPSRPLPPSRARSHLSRVDFSQQSCTRSVRRSRHLTTGDSQSCPGPQRSTPRVTREATRASSSRWSRPRDWYSSQMRR